MKHKEPRVKDFKVRGHEVMHRDHYQISKQEQTSGRSQFQYPLKWQGNNPGAPA